MKRLFTSVGATALAALLAWPGSLQAEPIDIGGHLVTFRGVEYDYPEPGESTWFYTVVSDGPPAISHVVFGLACDVIQILDAGTWDGADFASLNSGGGHPEPNHFPSAPIWDPTTLVTGMKFNGGFDEGETRHYYFTVNGNYEVDEIAVFAIKAGQLVLTGFVPGPSSDCEEVGPPPTASIALTKTGETIYETVQDCDVFGLAKAFNALIFGNFTAIGGDTEEPLAVGGTAWLTSGYSVGFALFGNPIPTHYGSAVDMLIVGGDLHDGSFGVNGNIVYGGTRYGPTRIMANGNVLRHVNPVTFDDAGNVPDDGSGVTFAELLARLTERGLQLAALADRGVAVKDLTQPWQAVLAGTDPQLNVFNLEIPSGSVMSGLLDIEAPPGSTVLVNIRGADVRIRNTAMTLTGVTRDTVLFHFVDATNIVFQGFVLTGSLLAPYASATLSGGDVEGRAVFGGDVYTHTGFEFHNYPFNGSICVDMPGTNAAIVYSFSVFNTGDVPLTNVTVTDPLVAIQGGPITLAPGQSDSTTFTGAYALTPEELAAGSFTNTAMASGYAPDGTTVTASDSDVQVFWPVGPTLLVDDPDGGSGAGLTTLGGADPLCITLALAAGPYAGMLADWWLVALPHQGSEWYYLDANAGWIGVPAGQAGALQPFYQGPLTSLRFPVSLFCAAALAPGQYTLVFAVDPLDGLINYPGGPILYDTKTLTR